MKNPRAGDVETKTQSGIRVRAKAPDSSSDDGKKNQQFARMLTKSLFGRHYWDDAMELEKQRATQNPKWRRRNR